MSILLKFFHFTGIVMWLTCLGAYLILRYHKKDFVTEGYRAYFRRRFTWLGIFGFTLIFATGMAMIITENYAGSHRLPEKFMVKMLFVLIVLIAGINAWGIDVGIVKRIDELKQREGNVPIDEMHGRIGRLNQLMNLFVLSSLIVTLGIIFYVLYIPA